jgi:Fe-S-cluster containining protein
MPLSTQTAIEGNQGGELPARSEPLPEWITANIEFKIASEPVRAEIKLPPGPIRARQMLPLFQSLTNLIVDEGVAAAEKKSEKLSCKQGCGACCRQLVPISKMEAHHLRDLVEHLPEPRRSEIRGRFAEASRRLQKEGLLEKLQKPEETRVEDIRPVGLGYFSLQIPCPFLEAESCSIYEQRPLACREYLVSSPAQNCYRPSQEGIRGIGLAGKMSHVISRLDDPKQTGILPWVPLILALEWAEAHPEEPPPRPAPEILREVFDRLAGQKKPPEDPSPSSEQPGTVPR